MIHRCALAVIERRGKTVTGPSMSPVDATEADFLQRHVKKLRASVDISNARGQFRPGSLLRAEMQELLRADDDNFLTIARRHASELATAMAGTGNAKACVMALLTEGSPEGAEVVSLLKLDAEIEAAQMETTTTGVRLRVFQELLPRPGEIQKGFSWPDPRAPRSQIIVLDKIVAGSSTKYFRDAFAIDVSPRASDTEAALKKEIEKLPAHAMGPAIEAADAGGDAEEVVTRIQQVAAEFNPSSDALGGGGRIGGRIRKNFSQTAKRDFSADGIELRVPLSALDRVRTEREGAQFVTRILTDSPLTPVQDGTVGADS